MKREDLELSIQVSRLKDGKFEIEKIYRHPYRKGMYKQTTKSEYTDQKTLDEFVEKLSEAMKISGGNIWTYEAERLS